jgi:hypothetical protein
MRLQNAIARAAGRFGQLAQPPKIERVDVLASKGSLVAGEADLAIG